MEEAIPTLETPRLRLRPFRPADAEPVAALVNDRAVTATTRSLPYPYLREYADQWIATHAALFAERGEISLAIERRDSGELAGAISLLVAQAGALPEIGYWLGRQHWGRGYASEAVAAVVEHVRARLGARAITARCMVENPASAAVLVKNGFRRTGRAAEVVIKDGRAFEVDEFRLDLTAASLAR